MWRRVYVVGKSRKCSRDGAEIVVVFVLIELLEMEGAPFVYLQPRKP